MSVWFVATFGVEPWFFVVLMLVSLVGFLVSSMVGVGGALLLIPLLAQRMPAAQAVALSAPVLFFSNILKGWVFRRAVHGRATLLVSALALPCAFGAALLSTTFDDDAILASVAVLIVLSVVMERGFDRQIRLSDPALVFWGAVTGVVSGLCGAAGPPTAIGLRGYGLEREAFVGSVACFALLLQLVKVPAYVHAGVLPVERWPLVVALGVMAVVGVALARPLLRVVPRRALTTALDVLLLASAAAIITDLVAR